MDDAISRRDLLKTLAVAGTATIVPTGLLRADPSGGTSSPAITTPAGETRYGTGDIVELSSTSDVFTPPRGRSFQKFSFDFPEPAVVFGDHRFTSAARR